MAKRQLNKKTSELLITVVADKKLWQSEQEKAFKVLSENLIVKGFRKGKVPANIAKKEISQEEVYTKAIKKTLDVLIKEAAKEVKEEDFILDSPTYKIDKISDAELEVTFIYPVYPEIKLGDYKKLGVKYEEAKVGDEVVKLELDKLREQHAMLGEKPEGKLEKGDTAIFDFKGFVDGEAFEGGEAANYELEIGSGQFIAGFEDQMIGMKKGDKKDIKVTFPKEYHSKDLAGKPATFKITLNEIKVKILPELNDDFAKESGVPNMKTLAELKKYILKVFTEQARQDARGKFQREAFAKIKKQTEINVPTALIVKEMQQMSQKFMQDLQQQGIQIDQYLQMTGQTAEQLDSQFKSTAEDKLKDSLIFAEIAKLEKIEITDKDYEEEFKKLAKVYGQEVEQIKNMVTKAQMQIPMTNDKVIDKLIEYNTK